MPQLPGTSLAWEDVGWSGGDLYNHGSLGNWKVSRNTHKSGTARSQGGLPGPAMALPLDVGQTWAWPNPTTIPQHRAGPTAGDELQGACGPELPAHEVQSPSAAGHTWLSPGAAAGHAAALHPLWDPGRARETPQSVQGLLRSGRQLCVGNQPLGAGAPPAELPAELVTGRVHCGSPPPPPHLSRQPRNSLGSPLTNLSMAIYQ